MESGDGGGGKLGTLKMKEDRNNGGGGGGGEFGVDSSSINGGCADLDVSVSSPFTRQKAAAAKQIIENHYKNYLQGLHDRLE
ncbi:hypothetical protein MKX01_025583, partial [Papaver californicum]